MPVSEEPISERDQVADEAMSMVRERLKWMGLTPLNVFVAYRVAEKELGLDSVSAGWSEEEMSAADVFAFFLSYTISLGEEIGLIVKVVPMEATRAADN